MSHSKWLRQAAEEIARAGHNGWGNTCLQAADGYDALAARLAEAERLLREVIDLPLWDEGVGGSEVGNRIESFLRPTVSASVTHWQCLQCGRMNTGPYCPCTAEPDVTCATHGCTYRDGKCIRCWRRETVISSHEKAIDSLLDDCATVYGGPVQHDSCCLDYPRCDCNSPPEPDDDWLCFQRPAQPKVTP